MRSSRQFSFLNGPNKLVLVCMYRSTITGYPYCSLVGFCFFFVLFYALLHAQKHSQARIDKQNKNKLTLNNKGNNFLSVQSSKKIKVTYFALV